MQHSGKYEVIQFDTAHKRQFLFESSGIRIITKVIEYTQVMEIDKSPVFNLAFGDYDQVTGIIDDHVNSNNGDMYKVFNTVLYTILLFFQTNPRAMVFVKGSDNKRSRIYSNYVKKNFNTLSKEFVFYGGRSTQTKTIFLPYIPGEQYDCLLLHMKKTTNFIT